MRALDAGDSIKAVTHRVVDNEAYSENSGQIVVSVAAGDINGRWREWRCWRLPMSSTSRHRILTSRCHRSRVLSLQTGTTALYAVYSDGAQHGSGPGSPPSGHPNVNAYLPGWPASIATLAIDLLPVVGEGPDGAPVIANVNGGNDLEVGIFGTAGPGVHSELGRRLRSTARLSGRDRTLLMDAPGGGRQLARTSRPSPR